LTYPEKSEWSIDEEGRALGYIGARGLVKAFHLGPQHLSVTNDKATKPAFTKSALRSFTILRRLFGDSRKQFIR
jgi:hypothetical protein